MPEARWADSTFWLYTIRLDPEVTGVTPDTVIGILASERIQARPLWQPMHLSPVYQGSFHMPCPNAEAVHDCNQHPVLNEYHGRRAKSGDQNDPADLGQIDVAGSPLDTPGP